MVTNDPTFRELRRLAYHLKRRYGQPFLLRRTSNDATDFQTGAYTANLTTVFVRRGVWMSAKDARKFMRTITDVARIQNFAQGGMFDGRTRFLLIDQDDVPDDFPIDLNMHVVAPVGTDGSIIATGKRASKRWEAKGLEEYEASQAFILTLESTDGSILDPTNPNPNPPAPTPNPSFVVKVADYQLLTSDNDRWFSNRGATGLATFTLPPTAGLTAGTRYRLVVESAQVLTVRASGIQVMQVGGTTSVPGGQADGTLVGSELDLVWTGTIWFANSSQGQWDVT